MALSFTLLTMASKRRSSHSKPSHPDPSQPKGSRRLRRAQLLMDGKQKKDGGDESVEVVLTSDEDVTSAVSHDDSDPGNVPSSLLFVFVQLRISCQVPLCW